MVGSDIGHWDVPDITTVLAEAYELVDDGLMGEDDFRDFTFGNAAKLHGSMNPNFFQGTVVEDAVRSGKISIAQRQLILQAFKASLHGYTYFEHE